MPIKQEKVFKPVKEDSSDKILEKWFDKKKKENFVFGEEENVFIKNNSKGDYWRLKTDEIE